MAFAEREIHFSEGTISVSRRENANFMAWGLKNTRGLHFFLDKCLEVFRLESEIKLQKPLAWC